MPHFHLQLRAALASAVLLFGLAARADPPVASPTGGVTVSDAWARASAGNAATGAAYLTLTGGNAADQVVGISTPVARTAEVHESFTDNGMMKMRAAPSVSIPAGKIVTFAPGGYHVMLMGLRQPLIAGQSFPLTVTFAHSAPVTVEVSVRALGHAGPKSADDHMQMH